MQNYEMVEKAQKLSALINTLCKNEEILTRQSLLKQIKEAEIPYSQKILMPMRKRGYYKVSKGLFFFIRQNNPVFYKEFERILLASSAKQKEIYNKCINSKKRQNTKQNNVTAYTSVSVSTIFEEVKIKYERI